MIDKNEFPRLGPIIIGTSDMEKAKKFYISVFGITIEKDENPTYISARGVDRTQIELEGNSEHRFPNWAEHNIGTYKNSEFTVTDINSFLETVEKYGGRIITKPVIRPWGGFGAEIADPDGNIFLISQK